MEGKLKELYQMGINLIEQYPNKNCEDIEDYENIIANFIHTYLALIEANMIDRFEEVAGTEKAVKLNKMIEELKKESEEFEEYLELETQWEQKPRNFLKRLEATLLNKMILIESGGSSMELLQILYEKASRKVDIWIAIDADLKSRKSLEKDLKTLEDARLVEREFVQNKLAKIRLTQEALDFIE